MELSKKEKLDMPYVVKADGISGTKEVDTSKRIVDVIANTYYWFDSDWDVLVPGCCAKSIAERGPGSQLPGKIKHLANHDLREGIGRIEKLEETIYEGKYVLRAESYMSETDKGEETLIKYQEGIIDQHSIGFRYMQLEMLEEGSTEWDEMIKLLINPEDAEKVGMMWVAKELKLWEFSSLDGFGANRLTPYIGSKSDNKAVRYNNLITKLDTLHEKMRSGSKDTHTIKLQEQQIKQMIYELYNQEPSIKDTFKKPPKDDTFDVDKYLQTIKFLQ
jgi:hypothetical protein